MRKMRSCKMMKILLLLLSFMMLLSMTAMAISDSADTSALMAFKNGIIDRSNKLSNWQGNDPCGDAWMGVICVSTNSSTNVSHVSELQLFSYNLEGQLAPELGNLSQLSTLNLMFNNNINGTIPSSIGNLQNLNLLLLNGNQLTGSIPSELGQLTKLTRLQLDENQLSGPLPLSLGNITQVQHFHMSNNSINGSIPATLGRLQNLLHLLLDNNDLEGPLPEEIANISTITIVQLDNNPKIASTIPQQWVQIPSLIKLSLKNCSLYGPIPELGAPTNLSYVDLSLNKLSGGLPSNLSSNLVTVNFVHNYLTGSIPDSYGTLQQLQALQLANNFLNGTIPASLGSGLSFSNNSNTLLVDLQNNNLTGLDTELLFEATRSTNINVWLAGNQELCSILATTVSLKVCTSPDGITVLQNTSSSNSQTPNSTCHSCSLPSMPVVDVASQVCRCAQPIPVLIRLKSPGFSFFDRYTQNLISLLEGALNISASQVQIQSSDWDAAGERLYLNLLLFPPNSTFNSIEVNNLYNVFSTFILSLSSNWSLSVVGPYDLLNFNTVAVVQTTSKGLSTGSIVGIVVGAVAFVAILAAFATFLILHRHHKKQRRLRTLPPGVKIAGVKGFTYEELAKASKGFSPENEIGQGGYGKVYRGTLEDDTIVGIKRALKESMQGAHQFYTEIELLSRLHHRNLVQLIGYCNDKGEQMLVYEFMVNGNLRDHLIPTEEMDFAKRIHIALGTARGILYLHTEANPPIFHRDIKANNILLDRNYNAKVADFGLSKSAPEPNVDDATPEHVSTTVKGTPGYMDPQYFMTNKFTDKSDVYSFGIVLLELITGMMPISRGKYILREVKEALEANKISSIIDPCMGTSYPPDGLDRLLKLALSCCSQENEDRPQMIDLTRELQDIWRLTAASYPMLSKMDSDISSHNFGTMGQSSQTSGPYSVLDVEAKDGTGKFSSISDPHVWPR
ncbi:unnamed protein product [Sphagnum troendelagicum]